MNENILVFVVLIALVGVDNTQAADRPADLKRLGELHARNEQAWREVFDLANQEPGFFGKHIPSLFGARKQANSAIAGPGYFTRARAIILANEAMNQRFQAKHLKNWNFSYAKLSKTQKKRLEQKAIQISEGEEEKVWIDLSKKEKNYYLGEANTRIRLIPPEAITPAVEDNTWHETQKAFQTRLVLAALLGTGGSAAVIANLASGKDRGILPLIDKILGIKNDKKKISKKLWARLPASVLYAILIDGMTSWLSRNRMWTATGPEKAHGAIKDAWSKRRGAAPQPN